MATNKKSKNVTRPERRMDRTGAGRNLLASMEACRAALGMYVDKNRGRAGQKRIYARARVNPPALSRLENAKGIISKADALALMRAMQVPEAARLANLYSRLSRLIEIFGSDME